MHPDPNISPDDNTDILIVTVSNSTFREIYVWLSVTMKVQYIGSKDVSARCYLVPELFGRFW